MSSVIRVTVTPIEPGTCTLPQRTDAADLVMPSKLTGMLASGRAVAATAHPDTELGKAVADCGLLSPPGDAVAFAAAIRALARNPAQRAAFGLAGRRHAESCLGMEPILQRFVGELALLTGGDVGGNRGLPGPGSIAGAMSSANRTTGIQIEPGPYTTAAGPDRAWSMSAIRSCIRCNDICRSHNRSRPGGAECRTG